MLLYLVNYLITFQACQKLPKNKHVFHCPKRTKIEKIYFSNVVNLSVNFYILLVIIYYQGLGFGRDSGQNLV